MQKGKADLRFDYAVRRITKNKTQCLRDRITDAVALTEEFIADNGEFPDGESLDRLADFILADDFSDSHPDKITREEYPVLSPPQIYRRNVAAIALSDVPSLDTLATDLRNYRYPKRKDCGYDHLVDADAEKYAVINAKQTVFSYIDETLTPNDVQIDTEEGRGEEYKKWAHAVKERDGWACQNPTCARRTRVLHAHHLESWNHAEDLRLEMWNGVTLCKHCHYAFHNEYGYGFNTREQYLEWLATIREEQCDEVFIG